MTAEVLFVLIKVNLVVALAVLVIALIRGPVRRLCGPDVAYSLWILAPWFGFAELFASLGFPIPISFAVSEDLVLAAGVIWAGGSVVSLTLLALGQQRVLRRARSGRMGPAVVGILRPRVFLPTDFATRFNAGEQAVIRFHERAHLLRHDVLANAVMALARSILWFNPMVHLAAGLMRQDQEMACDATVLEERPEQRRRYAATLLKTQLVHDKSLGTACAWMGAHPLETRIRAVAQGRSDPFSEVSGTLFLAAVGVCLMLAFAVQGDRVFHDLVQTQFASPLR